MSGTRVVTIYGTDDKDVVALLLEELPDAPLSINVVYFSFPFTTLRGSYLSLENRAAPKKLLEKMQCFLPLRRSFTGTDITVMPLREYR